MNRVAEPLRTVDWRDGKLVLIDQTKIPGELAYIEIDDARDVADAIRGMVVRGAPAIGAAAAFGVALAVRQSTGDAPGLEQLVTEIREARPTAVNLRWAVDRVLSKVRHQQSHWRAAYESALAEAQAICDEDVAANESIARFGQELLEGVDSILTHCNTGDLATVSGGTAFGVIRRAHEQKPGLKVFADETRPRLQGLKLTAWEFARAGVPVQVIPDGAGAFLMKRGMVDAVIVGADRIAANGDTANKIGTYSLAVSASAHRVPFYVAAPTSTVDLASPSGDSIPIEERGPEELLAAAGAGGLPETVGAVNFAFDVTPARLITAIVTERGVLRPEYDQSFRSVL